MADDIPGVPQPPEGQEGAGQADVPYAEYLQRIPEQYRGDVQPVLDDWNKHVNGRFEQHAEHRKQWEPYEKAGVNQVDPEELQGWLQFRQAAMENPQAIQQWYDAYAQQNGLTPQQQQQQEPQTPSFVDPDLEQLLEQRLGPLTQQFDEIRAWREQQEEAARVQQATEQIEQQLAGLAEKHGDQFNQPLVEKFIANYIESDPRNAVQRAYQDSVEFVAAIEKQLVNGKLKQPAPAEAGGGTDATADPHRTLKEAGELALAQLRGHTST